MCRHECWPHLSVEPAGLFAVLLLSALTTATVVNRTGSRLRRADLGRIRTPRGLARSAREALRVLVIGELITLVAGLYITIWGSNRFPLNGFSVPRFWLAGSTISLAAGLASGLASEITTTGSLLALRRQCVEYAVPCGVLVGIGAAAGLGPAAGPWVAAGGALLGVLVGGLAFGGLEPWIRYWIGTRTAVRQDLLPRHTTSFLTWCTERGLLRMSGINLQFRHRRFQEWLAERAVGGAPVSVDPRGGSDSAVTGERGMTA